MDILSIISFLLPFGLSPFKLELLPIVFFVIIWGLFAFTIIGVRKNANAQNWEKNWYNDDNDSSNDLDVEHGSVLELSDVVATKSEKLADVMPGLILVIGLLGTFIGLGLALDKASSILSSADASAMDSSMTQLMGMLEGLGAKFKTSTWGLLAFLLLKPIMTKNGYEERRLKWVIEKVKREFDAIRSKRESYENEKNQKILLGLSGVSTAIDNSHQALMQHAVQWQKQSEEMLNRQVSELQATLTEVPLSIRAMNQETSNWLKESVDLHRQVSDSMSAFIAKNDQVVDKLGESAQGMSNAATNMGESASHLQEVITDFKSKMEDVIDMMKSDLNATIQGMNESFKVNMQTMSNDLSVATKDISVAVNGLSESVDKTMSDVSNTIGESMDLQKKSQQQFIVTTSLLQEKIIVMTELVDKLKDDITQPLQAVSASNRNVISLTKKLDDNTERQIESLSEMTKDLQALLSLMMQGNFTTATSAMPIRSNIQSTSAGNLEATAQKSSADRKVDLEKLKRGGV